MKTKYFNYSKYKNSSCKCNQGHIHHSRGEARYCDELAFLKKIGEIKEYQTQKRYDLIVNGIKKTTHIPDFLVTNNDNSKEVHEYKGFADKVWPIKKNYLKLYIRIFLILL